MFAVFFSILTRAACLAEPPPIFPWRWRASYKLLRYDGSSKEGQLQQSGETFHDWPRKFETHRPCMHPLADMVHYAQADCQTWWLGTDLFLQIRFANGTKHCCRWHNSWNATPSTPDFLVRGGAKYISTDRRAGVLAHVYSVPIPYPFEVGFSLDGLPLFIDYHTPRAQGSFLRELNSQVERVSEFDDEMFKQPHNCDSFCTRDWSDGLFPKPGEDSQQHIDALRYPHVANLIPKPPHSTITESSMFSRGQFPIGNVSKDSARICPFWKGLNAASRQHVVASPLLTV